MLPELENSWGIDGGKAYMFRGRTGETVIISIMNEDQQQEGKVGAYRGKERLGNVEGPLEDCARCYANDFLNNEQF